MANRQYTEESVREILTRASAYQDDESPVFTREQLLAMGNELGLSQEAITKAEQHWLNDDPPQPHMMHETPVAEASNAHGMPQIPPVFFILGIVFFAIFVGGGNWPWWVLFPLLFWGLPALRRAWDENNQRTR